MDQLLLEVKSKGALFEELVFATSADIQDSIDTVYAL